MALLRRLVLLALVGAGACVLASPSLAAPRNASLADSLGSTHFLVHFSTKPTDAFAVTRTQAADVIALAERAYAAEVADGYPPPLSDGVLGGDGRIDIYVGPVSGGAGTLGEAEPDGAGPTSSGSITLDKSAGLVHHVVAHELFHLIQFGIWLTPSSSEYWLDEASADWMGYRADGYNTTAFPLSPSHDDMSLDCRDPLGGYQCDRSAFYNGGYTRWPFIEFLTEKYGSSFVKDIYAQGASAGTAVQAVAAALTLKGTTLADAFDSWISTQLASTYSIKPLQGLKPITVATVETGVDTATFTPLHVAVNHLAARYVKFTRGGDDATKLCYNATLNLSISLPPGTSSKPAFVWAVKGASPVALAVSGNTATRAIPWDTCIYTSTAGYLSIPNASMNIDAADFVVSASMTVDANSPASAAPPPEPVAVNTPVVPVTGADVAPTLQLFGPEVLRLSAEDTQLRVIVESNGAGTVQAKIGATSLGTAAIRGGNNDVRFKLPSSLLTSLRRSAAASNVLSLTPVSASGATTGTPVTRVVRIDPAAKARPKAKPKPKRKLKRRS